MKNLQVKKQINKKLKLYRTSIVDSIALNTLGIVGSGYANDYISTALFGNDISLERLLFCFGLSYAIVFPLSLNFTNIVCNIPFDEVSFLKVIKKELKNGVNRFDNVSEEDFEIELAKEKKKYFKNKAK